jgi:class 3 adenylate cyclase
MIDESHAEFDQLIGQLAAADDKDEQGTIRKAIWDRFGTTGVSFISDMAGFSSTSRSMGVTHFLKLIHRAREIIRPAIVANQGLFLKHDADNCYAFFESPGDAVRAALQINRELFHANQQRNLNEHIFLSVGIDYGELLLIGESDYYGDPVNTASKLGEDLAIRGETLVTERALHHTTISLSENVERIVARISDIEIAYVRIPMTEVSHVRVG